MLAPDQASDASACSSVEVVSSQSEVRREFRVELDAARDSTVADRFAPVCVIFRWTLAKLRHSTRTPNPVHDLYAMLQKYASRRRRSFTKPTGRTNVIPTDT